MKPIFISASPNTQKDDVILALKNILQPWNWFPAKEVLEFEKDIEKKLGIQAVAMDSARSAFYLALKNYNIKNGDEVIVPSFTCLVVANPVLWVGAKPIYVDIKDDYDLDFDDLKNKLNPKVKAILIQHTFGKVIDVNKVRKIVGKDVKIIEDIAHALGGKQNNNYVGKAGDASIATFGIEKVISSVRGGMLLSNDSKLIKSVKKEVTSAPNFSYFKVFVLLLNPILWFVLTPIYYFGIKKLTIGRAFVWLGHKIKLFGNMIEPCEYYAKKPSWFPARMPGVLAVLGRNQLNKIDLFNQHRLEIVKIYDSELNNSSSNVEENRVYLRYPVLVTNPEKVHALGKKNKIVFGDWYKNILYAPEKNLKFFFYSKGLTKNSERLAKHIINLPTGINVSKSQAKVIAKIIKPYLWK